MQLHFLKNIWIALCLTFCNLSVFTFLINSFSITFMRYLRKSQQKLFTASRLSRSPDVVTFLTSCSSPAISLFESLIKTVSSDCTSSAMPFYLPFLSSVYVCWINTWLWCNCLRTKVDIFIKCDLTRYLLKQLVKFSINLFNYDWHNSNVKPTFFKALLDGLRGCASPNGLKPGHRFQYVNVLNYLRSRFPFIDKLTT